MTAENSDSTKRYRTLQVVGHNLFYREAGVGAAPALLLLHGYPSSSGWLEPLIND